MTDPRLPPEAAASLREWLGEEWSVEPLRGDASVRAYFRIVRPGGSTLILCHYPEAVRAQMARVVAAAKALAGHAPVPAVLHHTDAVMLQEDAGERTLFDVLHADREEGVRLYRRAVELLAQFQEADGSGINPPFTAGFFFSELQMTRQYFLAQLLGQDAAGCESLLQTLCDNVTRHPYRLCHRDYHGQNIHVLNDDLFIIDYQDLRMGPDTYDIASLLRDRGVAQILGEDTELELLEHYRTLIAAGDSIRHRYFETLLQRSIKILGTFARQPLERGRLYYLDFIPATLESIARCLRELPEYRPLGEVFPETFDVAAAKERILHGSTQDHAPAG